MGRDDFSKQTTETLAKRVNYHCSNPGCSRSTSGPNTDPDKSTNIGVAAHIKAAAPGGPRYDSDQTPEERSSIENGIWLCQDCAKLIDSDVQRFPVSVLGKWKATAEQNARHSIEQPKEHQNSNERCGGVVLPRVVAREDGIVRRSITSSMLPPIFTPQLSKEAQEILLEAAQSRNGIVGVIHSFGGTLEIQTNDKQLVSSHDPRTSARWEAAVNRLTDNGYLISGGKSRELFRITQEGYDLADRLRDQQSAAPDSESEN